MTLQIVCDQCGRALPEDSSHIGLQTYNTEHDNPLDGEYCSSECLALRVMQHWPLHAVSVEIGHDTPKGPRPLKGDNDGPDGAA